jgi:branched-chain amino acid transport system permease protein
VLGPTGFGAPGGWLLAPQWHLQIAAVMVAILVAMAATGVLGLVFERLFVRPVYGQHLKQILITMGGMIVIEELIKSIWGTQQIPLPLPEALRGAFILGDAAIERFRLLAVLIGLIVLAILMMILGRTKIGLLVRAGVEDREMVESLGYPVRRLFIGVFVAGSALAGLGGVLWGMYQQTITPQIGAQVNVLIFIVIIIGGLGSVMGSFVAALLVGLMGNYTGFLAPKLALFSNIALMVAILIWRPEGLRPVTKIR